MKLYSIKKECELLGSSWRDSLKIMIPKNFKLFLLVTLNAFIQALKPMVISLWWFFIPWFGLEVASFWGYRFTYAISLEAYILLLILLRQAALFLLYLSVRPSVKIKNNAYYLSYFFRFILFVLSDWGVWFGLNAAYQYPIFNKIMHYGLFLLPWTPLYLISPIVIFTFFFYLDSDGSILSLLRSIWQGFKMLIYNYPFCVLSMSVLYAILIAGSWIHTIILSSLDSYAIQLGVIGIFALLFVIFLILTICYFNNFYVKKVHDQFNLYMPIHAAKRTWFVYSGMSRGGGIG